MSVCAALRAWAPLPLRLALGGGLIYHGGIKLFAPGGHANIAHLLGPARGARGEPDGVDRRGRRVRRRAGDPSRRAPSAHRRDQCRQRPGPPRAGRDPGGIPVPLPGGDPLPSFREAFLILAAALTLVLGGAGPFSIGGHSRSGASGKTA